MGWIADLLKEIPSAARYKSQLDEAEAERVALRAQVSDLTTRLADALREIEQIRAATQPQPNADRPEPEHQLLLLLLSRDGLLHQEIARHLKIGEQAARHHITELNDAGLIRLIPLLGPNSKWYLSDDGRKYLNARGLLQ